MDDDFAAIYAIGDVHGCIDKLTRLEALIEDDAAKVAGVKLIVRLGDYVDRGKDSAGVIDYLSGRGGSAELKRVSLLGNHESMMLDVLDGHVDLPLWLDFGGGPTIRSYGVDINYLTHELRMSSANIKQEFIQSVPSGHVEFLNSLPISLETRSHIFVHAGVRPSVPWEEQVDDDLLYIRNEFLAGDICSFGKTIVHGHTPGTAVVTRHRIGIDTGAHFGGPLTAVRILPEGISLLEVR